MFQRLPIAFAQVKTGDNSESLLNEIRQIVYLCINQSESQKEYKPHNRIYSITYVSKDTSCFAAYKKWILYL